MSNYLIFSPLKKNKTMIDILLLFYKKIKQININSSN